MTTRFLFFAIMFIPAIFSCSKNPTGSYVDQSLIGKWKLTKSCVCNSCINTIPFYKNQTLVFSPGGRVQLFGAVGNSEQHYTGIYSITKQSYGKVLNIILDTADSNKNFLFIPGSVIYSEAGTKLVLDLNTPYYNMCLYQNTYTEVPH